MQALRKRPSLAGQMKLRCSVRCCPLRVLRATGSHIVIVNLCHPIPLRISLQGRSLRSHCQFYGQYLRNNVLTTAQRLRLWRLGGRRSARCCVRFRGMAPGGARGGRAVSTASPCMLGRHGQGGVRRPTLGESGAGKCTHLQPCKGPGYSVSLLWKVKERTGGQSCTAWPWGRRGRGSWAVRRGSSSGGSPHVPLARLQCQPSTWSPVFPSRLPGAR